MLKIVLSLFLVINLYALQESQIESYMETNINLVTKMLKEKKLNKEAIGKRYLRYLTQSLTIN